ncbi:unnamed protein product [Symbiodinium sp. CCMP2592]|nr:unnamed protein product [Symbiodinium sp. CCMP2592]
MADPVDYRDVYVGLYNDFIKDQQSVAVLRKQSIVLDKVCASGFLCSEDDLENTISKDIETAFLGNLPEDRDDGMILEDYDLEKEAEDWKNYSSELVRSADIPTTKEGFDEAVYQYLYANLWN